MSTELLIPALAVLFTLAAAGLALFRIMPTINFIYPNARLHARSNYLIDEKKSKSLLKASSLDEFAALLKDTDYEEEFNEITDMTILEVHKAIEKHYYSRLQEVYDMSPSNMKFILDKYNELNEIKFLKVIYRSRFLGITLTPDVEKMLIPRGNVDRAMHKRLLDTKSIADIKVVMSKTHYAKVFNEDYPTIEAFETALGRFVIERVYTVIDRAKIHEKEALRSIISILVDIMNISVLLKLRIRRIPKENQREMIIPSNSELSQRIPDLIKAGSMADFAAGFKGTPYEETIKKAHEKYESDRGYYHFEGELRKFLRKFLSYHDLLHMLGPHQILSYVVKKDIEMKNMITLTKCIDEKIDQKKIEEMVL